MFIVSWCFVSGKSNLLACGSDRFLHTRNHPLITRRLQSHFREIQRTRLRGTLSHRRHGTTNGSCAYWVMDAAMVAATPAGVYKSNMRELPLRTSIMDEPPSQNG